MSNRLTLAFLTIAVSLGFLYFVAPACVLNQTSCFGDPTRSIAPSVYRLLQPAIEKAVASNATSEGLLLADTVLQMAIVAVVLPLLYAWLKRWGSADNAIRGVFVFAIVWILAQHYWFRSVSTSLEILFVVATLVFISRGWLWIAVIVILASLNRETGLVIAGLYAAYHWREKPRESIALILIWAGVTAAIHVMIGSYPHVLGLEGTLHYNLEFLPDAVIANLLLIPLAVAMIMGYWNAPPRLQRFVGVSLVYIVAVIVGGSWGESQRLILPILPAILPTSL